MARLTTTLRFVTGMLAPGGVLLLAAWALQTEEVVRDAAAPYAVYFCFGALAAALLLSWYNDQSRLLCIASAVVLTVAGLEQLPGDVHVARLAAAFLLPVNFILFTSLREAGVMTLDGLLKVAVVVGQVFGVRWIGEGNDHGVRAFLTWGERSGSWSWLPLTAQLSFAIAALTLLTLVFLRRSKVEQGLLWALVAMFLGLNQMVKPDALLFYAGTTGLVLVFAVLEHGYDIAYRDELTGLLGRRAFNNVMGQLGRTYAIAMCDVDHFKRFNDSHGHDLGDQVLRMVAAKLSKVGGGGRAFRYGGEEFAVVFAGRSAREAEPFVESVRQAIADTGFVLRSPERPAKKPRQASAADQKKYPTIRVTISVGLAEKSKRHSTPELVLEAADAALYRAKEAGRNCVKLAESTPKA
jgi:diguanylate cyclase (GGDEF)-like protein